MWHGLGREKWRWREEVGFKICFRAQAGVAQWVEHWPVNQRYVLGRGEVREWRD